MELTPKEKFDISYYIAWILFSSAVFNFISYMYYATSGDTSDKWFTRQFLSLICLGLSGIIFSIKNRTK